MEELLSLGGPIRQRLLDAQEKERQEQIRIQQEREAEEKRLREEAEAAKKAKEEAEKAAQQPAGDEMQVDEKGSATASSETTVPTDSKDVEMTDATTSVD
jgi:micrococcal nuclease